MIKWLFGEKTKTEADRLREEALRARISIAQERWDAGAREDFEKRVEEAAKEGRMGLAILWGEEKFFLEGCAGATWAKSKGIRVDRSFESNARFWMLRW